MNHTALLIGCLLSLILQPAPARADAQPTAFEKALYDKSRYTVLSRLSDDDFTAYCVTMNIGGETLIKLHDQIMVKQAELADLTAQGFTAEQPQVAAVNAAIKSLRSQYAVKITEARKGLEVEAKIAEETLGAISQVQR